VLYGLTNSPATLQVYIDDCLWTYIDRFTVCFVEDIYMYSTTEIEHKDHVLKVLQPQQDFRLYCKRENCQFGVQKVTILECVINSDRMGMESDRIARIADRPPLESVPVVQVLLRFPNFYRRFIRNYAKVTAPMSNLLKTAGLPGVATDWGGPTRISKGQKGLNQSTIPSAFHPAKSEHFPAQCKRLRNCQQPEQV
jgi:hypothetical protein